ncbi:DUF2232 domain-containing protein [Halobacillus sp. BAB-2008]|uniref:DUF2232 domain-containing protein n=1 Tax=Halobacillus sp. BAB-2008 TaxID=1246484 RepID=UPI0002A4FBAE|nr:DUF2232 domain-containing protein [Halobacillus sp. BAB-2008]ELK46868.1 hypothetical protein D479_08985 [Halobacillus sp. BAB-2008]
MNKSRRLTEGALMAGIYLILLLLSLYMPIIGPFMIFVLPVPFAYYAHRHGWKPGAWCSWWL